MKKRIVPLLLAVAMVLTFAACGGSSESSTASSESTSSASETSSEAVSSESEAETTAAWGPDNPIELTAANSQSPIQGDFNDMVILKEYAEESGIHITFQNIPSSDRETQLSLMLNSGELPDILFKMSVSATDQAKYAAEELFVPLTDYEELMPNLRSWFNQYPTAEQAVTMSDGKIYAAPYILAGDAIRCGSKWWFNSEVLEKTGFETPTTTADLHDFLVACKSLDYNENGDADDIPLTSDSIDTIEQYFYGSFGLMNHGSSHTRVFTDDNDELAFAWNSENWREEMRYLNQLYTEGLIDQDIFTMDFAQEIAKCSTGRAHNFIMVNTSPVAGTKYEELNFAETEPFEGPNGDKIWSSYSMPASTTGQFVITYKCQEKGEDYVKAAMTWMDHWYSEEGIISYFMGVKDVTYEEDADSPGGLKLTDAVLNDPDGRNFEEVLAEYVPWAGGANPSVATNEFFKGGETWPAYLVAVEGLQNYFPEEVWTSFTGYWTGEEADEMGTLAADLDNYHEEWRGYFVTGQKSLDADWDEYVNGYTGMKLDRYMELYQKGYDGYLADQG